MVPPHHVWKSRHLNSGRQPPIAPIRGAPTGVDGVSVATPAHHLAVTPWEMVLLRLFSLSMRGWFHPIVFGSLYTSALAAKPPITPIPWSPHWRPPRYTPPPPPTTSLLHPERWYFFVSPASRCEGGSTHTCSEVPTPQFRPPDRPSSPSDEPPLAATGYTRPSPPTSSPLHPERWYFFVSRASRCVGGSTHTCLEVSTPQLWPPHRPSRPSAEPPLAGTSFRGN